VSSQDFSLLGVYDADGSLSGELRYWFGARIGRAHCSLCDITHGLFREKQEWRECKESLNVEFLTFHRDDAPSDVLELCGHELPVVVARSGAQLTVILGAAELESIGGEVSTFHDALVAACAKNGFVVA